jgi:hypothetical protein
MNVSFHAANPVWARDFAELNQLVYDYHLQALTLYAFGKLNEEPGLDNIGTVLCDQETLEKFFREYCESSARLRRKARERFAGRYLSPVFSAEKWECFRPKVERSAGNCGILGLNRDNGSRLCAFPIIEPIISGTSNQPASLFAVPAYILLAPSLFAAAVAFVFWRRYKGAMREHRVPKSELAGE